MTDLEAYKDKFSESGRRVLQNSMDESRKREQNYIGIEHILFALVGEETEFFNTMMRELNVDAR
jgi:ATP-dependent Clp protease ATP-binding subunit ClpA